MRSKAWCREVPGCAAPESIFPIPTAPTRSTPAARSQSAWSFDVLHLLAQFFDLRLDFKRYSSDRQRFTLHTMLSKTPGVESEALAITSPAEENPASYPTRRLRPAAW